MKHILATLLVLGIVALLGWQIMPAQDASADDIFPQTVTSMQDAADGFPLTAIVCSVYVNNTYVTQGDSHDYIVPVSGYSSIERIQVVAVNPNAAQTCSLGVFTGGDSTLLNPHIATGRIGLLLPATGYAFYDLPIQCDSVAVTNLRITDDFIIYLYCKK